MTLAIGRYTAMRHNKEMRIMDTDEEETLIRGLMENYPEASTGNCMRCIRYDYERMIFSFHDDDTGKRYPINIDHLRIGFRILVGLALTGKYKNFTAAALYDGGNWDRTDMDAMVQCAIFGKVIYG